MAIRIRPRQAGVAQPRADGGRHLAQNGRSAIAARERPERLPVPEISVAFNEETRSPPTPRPGRFPIAQADKPSLRSAGANARFRRLTGEHFARSGIRCRAFRPSRSTYPTIPRSGRRSSPVRSTSSRKATCFSWVIGSISAFASVSAVLSTSQKTGNDPRNFIGFSTNPLYTAPSAR